MEILYNQLYVLFVEELMHLNIGYSFNKSNLYTMNELINAIDYIKHGNPSSNEILTVIQQYAAFK